MSTQFDIFGAETAAQPLPRNQDIAMRAVIAHDSGVHDDEVGALLHEARERHSADDRCRFCGDDGRQVLRALQKKRLVTRRKGSGMWTLPGEQARRAHERAREAAATAVSVAARSCASPVALDEHGLPVDF